MPRGIYKNPKERAKKISMTLKKRGIKPPVLWGKKNRLGKKHPHSEEGKRRMSKAKMGEKNPQWKGGLKKKELGIRHTIEYRLWREAVFARDNWTCHKYGTKGGELNSHHIKNFAQYPELRFAIDNGVTLSIKAHREFHRKYGIKNNTREQLEEFLGNSNF